MFMNTFSAHRCWIMAVKLIEMYSKAHVAQDNSKEIFEADQSKKALTPSFFKAFYCMFRATLVLYSN